MSFIEAWRNGQVVRKHTMENIRAENVAEHTWGVVLLLMMCWPDAPRHVVVAAQVHDCGERATGDMPGPTKWANPVLETEMDRLEHAHLMVTLPPHIVADLKKMRESEWAVVEMFDRLEFCISMARERRLGNTYAMLYLQRSLNKAYDTWNRHHKDFHALDPLLEANLNTLLIEVREEQRSLTVMR